MAFVLHQPPRLSQLNTSRFTFHFGTETGLSEISGDSFTLDVREIFCFFGKIPLSAHERCSLKIHDPARHCINIPSLSPRA